MKLLKKELGKLRKEDKLNVKKQGTMKKDSGTNVLGGESG
jgi:hypothetical protein